MHVAKKNNVNYVQGWLGVPVGFMEKVKYTFWPQVPKAPFYYVYISSCLITIYKSKILGRVRLTPSSYLATLGFDVYFCC